jgi:hypothetical protein
MPYSSGAPLFPTIGLLDKPLPPWAVVFGGEMAAKCTASARKAGEGDAADADAADAPADADNPQQPPETPAAAPLRLPSPATVQIFLSSILRKEALVLSSDKTPPLPIDLVFRAVVGGASSAKASSRSSRRRRAGDAAAAAAAAPTITTTTSPTLSLPVPPARSPRRSFTQRRSSSPSSSSASAPLPPRRGREPLILTPLTAGAPSLFLSDTLLHPRLCGAIVRQALRGDLGGGKLGSATVGQRGNGRVDRAVRDADSTNLYAKDSREAKRALAAMDRLARAAAAATGRCKPAAVVGGGGGGGGGLSGGGGGDPEGPLVTPKSAMLVRYKPGGRYVEHWDHGERDARTLTVLLYLNGDLDEEDEDDEEEEGSGGGGGGRGGGGEKNDDKKQLAGGATAFPRLFKDPPIPPPKTPATGEDKGKDDKQEAAGVAPAAPTAVSAPAAAAVAPAAADTPKEQEVKPSPPIVVRPVGPLPKGVERRSKEGLAVKPRAGRAVVFFNTTPGGEREDASAHAAERVERGVKWVLVAWFTAANRREED